MFLHKGALYFLNISERTSGQKIVWSFVLFFFFPSFNIFIWRNFSREEATSVFCDSFITLIVNHLPRTFAPCCRRRIWGKLKIMQSAELCQVIILISPHDWKEMTGLKFRFWTLSSVSGVFEDLGASSPSTHLRSFLPSFQKLPSFKIYLLSCGDMRCFPCSQGTVVPFGPKMVSSAVRTPSCREPRRWPNSWARSFGAVEVGLPILSEKIT